MTRLRMRLATEWSQYLSGRWPSDELLEVLRPHSTVPAELLDEQLQLLDATKRWRAVDFFMDGGQQFRLYRDGTLTEFITPT